MTGDWITTRVINQDIVAWVGQGRIADLTKETLGHSDLGVVRFRRRLLEELDRVAAGQDPKGVMRDPATNRNVYLPSVCRQAMIEGLPRAELAKDPVLGMFLRSFVTQAGQPEAITAEYERAIGHSVQRSGYYTAFGGRREAAE